ncbi:hypothetical protein KUTeg_024174 [Tegillarca granosa]|uniref:PDZ domain-containing protein n=1 Tax=Tegillarca granosa TaxID=220873 RepID=A0ABQ9E2X9_TEGGR|nr:hypothetical protein KUTeg_024174 [Tegillarca granosa]
MLGIKICGGCSLDGQDNLGIFIKRVLPGGLADIDVIALTGNLQLGDQILEVNGESLEGVTNERAVSILRLASASDHVEMVITRDEESRREFSEILERQNGISFPCTPLPTDVHSKLSPRSTTSSQGSDSLKKQSIQQSNYIDGAVPQDSLGSLSSPHLSNGLTNGNLGSSHDEHVVPNGTSDVHVTWLNSHPITTPSPQQHVPGLRHMMPSMASTPHIKNSTADMNFGSVESEMSPVRKSEDLSSVQSDSQLHVPSASLSSQSGESASPSLSNSQSLNRLPKSRNMSQLRKLSLDPHVRLKIEKLEVMCDITDVSESEDNLSLQEERDLLKRENEKLKILLKESRNSCFQAEEELSRIKKEAHGAIHETQELRTKVQLAQKAQRAARSMEQDYEEVVQMLEGEIAKLKLQLKTQNDTSPSTSQKVALLTCELRKSESSKKTYEVATEKLLQFAENVHDVMTGGQNVTVGSKSQGEPIRGNRPPGYLGKHKKLTPKTIGGEAKEIVQAVRSLIDAEPLPYGWEEAYTADGMKYYIK